MGFDIDKDAVESSSLKRELHLSRLELELLRDFVEFLFETELDYTTYQEMQIKFEEWERTKDKTE